MLILLVESEPRVGEAVSALVTASGHEVLRCHEPAWKAFPCVGMHSLCPLDAGVDAVVVARNRDNAVPSILEDGARCAARAGVPIVLVGPSSKNPYAEWTVATVPADAFDEIVPTIEQAVSDSKVPSSVDVPLEAERAPGK